MDTDHSHIYNNWPHRIFRSLFFITPLIAFLIAMGVLINGGSIETASLVFLIIFLVNVSIDQVFRRCPNCRAYPRKTNIGDSKRIWDLMTKGAWGLLNPDGKCHNCSTILKRR